MLGFRSTATTILLYAYSVRTRAAFYFHRRLCFSWLFLIDQRARLLRLVQAQDLIRLHIP
jgi:hypothetical protein